MERIFYSEHHFRLTYTTYSDKEIVNMVITLPYNEEAAAYLLYKRYDPLLFKVYRNLYNKDTSMYYDCLDDLFIYLKGKELDWNKLRTFEWKSKFGTWLKITAWNRFKDIKLKLIGKENNAISIDETREENAAVQVPDKQEYQKEELQQKILLMEAINKLKDLDQKFVIIKRLEGYNSKEIAELLKKSWIKHNIQKFNKEGKQIIPTSGYVDVRTQRAKENLKKIIGKLI